MGWLCVELFSGSLAGKGLGRAATIGTQVSHWLRQTDTGSAVLTPAMISDVDITAKGDRGESARLKRAVKRACEVEEEVVRFRPKTRELPARLLVDGRSSAIVHRACLGIFYFKRQCACFSECSTVRGSLFYFPPLSLRSSSSPSPTHHLRPIAAWLKIFTTTTPLRTNNPEPTTDFLPPYSNCKSK
jgi:hypothetical protein